MGWIEKISDMVKLGIDKILRKPLAWLPLPLLLCEILRRPGLSAVALTSAMIQKAIEMGIPTDKLPDGSDNMVTKFLRTVIAETVVTHIKDNLVTMSACPPGSNSMVGVGANAGGPVTVHSTNVSICSIRGLGL